METGSKQKKEEIERWRKNFARMQEKGDRFEIICGKDLDDSEGGGYWRGED